MICDLETLEQLPDGRERRGCPRCLFETTTAPGLPVNRRCGPPARVKAASALRAAGRAASAAISGQAVRVDAAEQGRRWRICQACPHWLPDNESCALCGCRGSFKARLATERCPDPTGDRWALPDPPPAA